MRVRFFRETEIAGRVYPAGDSVEVPDAVGARALASGLAVAVGPQHGPTISEPRVRHSDPVYR
mgnify:CR=1 FL=1